MLHDLTSHFYERSNSIKARKHEWEETLSKLREREIMAHLLTTSNASSMNLTNIHPRLLDEDDGAL